ncbi:hypothetical protein ABZ815_02205 [Nonomuraea sp. NPDC047529]|uniref:hypothetical protein n=1 Tax=Nonomuraea sp. NPDC047529 TaxID=3155623 RepID=UPI0033D5D1E3
MGRQQLIQSEPGSVARIWRPTIVIIEVTTDPLLAQARGALKSWCLALRLFILKWQFMAGGLVEEQGPTEYGSSRPLDDS